MSPQAEEGLKAAIERLDDALKETYVSKGKMEAFLEFGGKQITGIERNLEGLTQQIAVQGEALTNMTRLIFGDSRTTQSPSIRKDIDRHEQEILELRDNIRQLTELNKETLIAIGKLTDKVSSLESQIKPIVYLFQLIRNIPTIIWDKYKEVTANRWVRILIPVAGTLLAILIEYLRSIGVFQ